MRNELFECGIENTAVRFAYDADVVQIGSIIYVRKEVDRFEFSADETAGSVAHKVLFVTKRQPVNCVRHVTLVREPLLQLALARQLIDVAGLSLAEDEVIRRLQAIANRDVPFEKLTQESIGGGPRIHAVQAVIDRLALIHILGHPNVGSSLWMHYRSLIAYLFLTCFDLLGQDPDWVPFADWLNSKSARFKTEREAVVVSPADERDPIKIARSFFDAYNSRYSVGRGFKSFVAKTLPEEARQRLLATISIQTRVSPPLAGEEDAPTPQLDKHKIEWLFKLRNSYTHRADYVAGSHVSVLPVPYRSDDQWWFMGEAVGSRTTTNYAVSNGWLDALEAAVRAGLAQFFENCLEAERPG